MCIGDKPWISQSLSLSLSPFQINFENNKKKTRNLDSIMRKEAKNKNPHLQENSVMLWVYLLAESLQTKRQWDAISKV